jgi:hypothetical protein
MGEARRPSSSQVSPFILWRAQGDSLTVEFSRVALEQIRQACFAASTGLTSDRHGIGGLLLGTRLGSLRRVLDWQIIERDASSAQPFQLGEEEEIRLRRQIKESARNGMQTVGWFASRTRGSLAVSQEERRIHELFFTGSELLMLTMRILRSGDLTMAVHAPSPQHDGLLRAREPEIRIVPMSRSEFKAALANVEAAEEHAPAVPVPPEPMIGKHSAYLAFGFAVFLVAAAAIAILTWQLQQPAPLAATNTVVSRVEAHPKRLLSLHATYRSSRLSVEWDPFAYDISEISSASISCIIGERTRNYRVGPAVLRKGSFSIALRKPPDSVILSLQTFDRDTIRDSVSFVAPPKKN